MTADTSFHELLCELLSPLGHIVVKRMFDGAGVYCDGVIFALAGDGELYLKADDQTKARFEAEGLGPFVYEGKTRPVAMSYWRAPERLFDEPEEMRDWARDAIGVARAAKLKKAAAPKKKMRGVDTTTRKSKSISSPKRKRT